MIREPDRSRSTLVRQSHEWAPGTGFTRWLKCAALLLVAVGFGLLVSSCGGGGDSKSGECGNCSQDSDCQQGMTCQCFCFVVGPGCTTSNCTRLCAKATTTTCSI
jgi:hypothetical protein